MSNKCKTCKQEMPEIDTIAPCFCGKPAKLDYNYTHVVHVRCTDGETYCWAGPMLETEAEAIEAWNSMMSVKKVCDDINDDIAPCFCDKPAKIAYTIEDGIFVRCSTEMGYCWAGPMFETEKEAIEAWNSIQLVYVLCDEKKHSY